MADCNCRPLRQILSGRVFFLKICAAFAQRSNVVKLSARMLLAPTSAGLGVSAPADACDAIVSTSDRSALTLLITIPKARMTVPR